jgi:hypothetical protein
MNRLSARARENVSPWELSLRSIFISLDCLLWR